MAPIAAVGDAAATEATGEKEVVAPVAVGGILPDGQVSFFDKEGALQTVSMHSLAAGKTVVLVGVPGAFTPTCSLKHVPGYINKAAALKEKGVHEVFVLSVNDPFVMREWEKSFGGTSDVKFVADGSAKYVRALGLELDLIEKGLGIRSQRFALLIEDLKIKVANVEAEGEFNVSSADELLNSLVVN